MQGPSQAVQSFGPGCCCAFAPWFNLEPFYAYDGYTAPPKRRKESFRGHLEKFQPLLVLEGFCCSLCSVGLWQWCFSLGSLQLKQILTCQSCGNERPHAALVLGPTNTGPMQLLLLQPLWTLLSQNQAIFGCVSQECFDRCCNATTCQLREGAECAQGDCCQDCKVLCRDGDLVEA